MGYSLGWSEAYVISPLIFPRNTDPSGSWNRAMSRGKLTIEVFPVVGSTLTTISVSFRAWFRVDDESIPVRRMLIRAPGGGGVTPGVGARPPDGLARPDEGAGVGPIPIWTKIRPGAW